MFNFAYCPLSFVLRAPEGEMIRTPLVIFHQSYVIELFHSSGQQLCKFIGTDERFLHEKKVKTFRTGLGHQHGRRFIVLGH